MRLTSLSLLLAFSLPALAVEYPIGAPQNRNGMEIGAVYLQPDLDARGMTAKLIPGVSTVDYGGFVDLVEKYNTSHSWL